MSYYLFAAGILCAAAYLLLTNAAGCAADVKGGLGNTATASKLENWSLLPFVLFAPISIAAVGTHPRVPKVVALLWILTCLPVLWWFGIEAEAAAVVRCGSSRILDRSP